MRSSFDQDRRLTGSMERSLAVQRRGRGDEAPGIVVTDAVNVMRRRAHRPLSDAHRDFHTLKYGITYG